MPNMKGLSDRVSHGPHSRLQGCSQQEYHLILCKAPNHSHVSERQNYLTKRGSLFFPRSWEAIFFYLILEICFHSQEIWLVQWALAARRGIKTKFYRIWFLVETWRKSTWEWRGGRKKWRPTITIQTYSLRLFDWSEQIQRFPNTMFWG